MNQNLDHKDNELYKRVDEVLYYIWDPIGVSHHPETRDEYSSYVPKIVAMLKDSRPKDEIADYLANLSDKHMGLSQRVGKNSEVAELLIGWKKIIFRGSL